MIRAYPKIVGRRQRAASAPPLPVACPFSAALALDKPQASGLSFLDNKTVREVTTPEPDLNLEDFSQSADIIEAAAAVAELPTPPPVPDQLVRPSVPFSPEEVDIVFPWHMACDTNFRVVSLGSNLALRFDGVGPNTSMCSLVRIVHPMLETLSFDSVARLEHNDVMLLVRDTMYLTKTQGHQEDHTANDGALSSTGAKQTAPAGAPALSPEDFMRCRRDSIASVPYIACNPEFLYLRGEFLVRYDDGPELPPTGIVFLGTPSCGTLEQMNDLKISFDDIPIHSNGREVMHSHIQQRVTAELAQELLDMRSELDEAVAELRLEKAKQDALLHSILPPNIAEQLARGIRPPACKHVNVSMLFSDIVSFTTISSAASPNEIMDMLDNLFSRFDQLCEKHGVYKLETIGDAYLVTSGLPEACEDHADRLAAFAVDMLDASKRVLRPDTNEPLQIRVGLHTGSVTAGVAGTSRPRYCVFGDTVNVASRMESTSENGRIQLSGEFRRELLDAPRFKLVPRGTIDIKGKGQLQTFFLDGLHDDGLYPRDRAARSLNVVGHDGGGDTGLPASSSSLGISPRLGRAKSIHDHDSGISSKSRSVSPNSRSKRLPPRSDPEAHSQECISSEVSITDQSESSAGDDSRTEGTTGLREPACRPRLRQSDPSPGIERRAGRPRGASASERPPTISPTSADSRKTGPQGSVETRRSGRNLRAQRTASARAMARSPAVGVGSHTSSPPTDAESIDIAVFEETVEDVELAPGAPLTGSPILCRANSTGSLSPHKQRRPKHLTTSVSATALRDTHDYREAATDGPLSPDKSQIASRPYSAPSVITVGECDFDLVVKLVTGASSGAGAPAGAKDQVLSFLDGTLTLKQVAEGLEDANTHKRVLFYADAEGRRQLAPSLTLISLHKAMVRRGVRDASDLELHVWRRLPETNRNSTSV